MALLWDAVFTLLPKNKCLKGKTLEIQRYLEDLIGQTIHFYDTGICRVILNFNFVVFKKNCCYCACTEMAEQLHFSYVTLRRFFDPPTMCCEYQHSPRIVKSCGYQLIRNPSTLRRCLIQRKVNYSNFPCEFFAFNQRRCISGFTRRRQIAKPQIHTCASILSSETIPLTQRICFTFSML